MFDSFLQIYMMFCVLVIEILIPWAVHRCQLFDGETLYCYWTYPACLNLAMWLAACTCGYENATRVMVFVIMCFLHTLRTKLGYYDHQMAWFYFRASVCNLAMLGLLFCLYGSQSELRELLITVEQPTWVIAAGFYMFVCCCMASLVGIVIPYEDTWFKWMVIKIYDLIVHHDVSISYLEIERTQGANVDPPPQPTFHHHHPVMIAPIQLAKAA